MQDRAIPKLNTSYPTDILHVSAVIRHGQRTPYAANIPCWRGYHEADADTSKWDCKLTTWTSPPRFNAKEDYFLFEKTYDALYPPLGNELGGTCQKGQLLVPGYDQEMYNGKILRDAYFGIPEKGHQYGYMTLFLKNTGDDAAVQGTPISNFDPRLTVYRSDDEQRTIMSGEVLLRGLFSHDITVNDFVMKIHTADYKNDVMVPNESICPTLTELRNEAHASKEFQAFNSSGEANELRYFLYNELGADGSAYKGLWEEPMDNIIDCLMTTMCTDRRLPDKVNDFVPDLPGKERKGMFERLIDFATLKYSFHLKYKDALYAKLAMGPLWQEILTKMNGVSDIFKRQPDSSVIDLFDSMLLSGTPRLAIYSGHDTTLMPLLASLGDDVWDGVQWTPYASMLVIEIHKVNVETPDGIGPLAFRIIYNGEVITSRLDNCLSDSELCNLDILFQLIGPFATNDREQCALGIEAKTLVGQLADHTFGVMLQDPRELMIVVLIALGSAMFGWFVTYVAIVKKIPFKGKRKPLTRPVVDYNEVPP